MANKTQTIVIVVAALAVLLSSMWDARVAIFLAVGTLVALAVYHLFVVKKSDFTDPLNPEQIRIRRENLDKIMQLARSQRQITNDAVQKYLGVSDATATRYLEYLINLGKLVRVGERGQNVFYRLP